MTPLFAPAPAPGVAFTPSARYPDPAIEVLDPAFLKYRLYSSGVEQLASGLRWAEGPVWFGDGRYLLFSDVPGNRILRWDDCSGATSVFRSPSAHANGHVRDRQGRLVSCEHGTRRITRTAYDGRITVLAGADGGKRLNSPNDIVCASDGSLWFSDPSFGIDSDWEGDKAPSELPHAVYRLWAAGDNGADSADDADTANTANTADDADGADSADGAHGSHGADAAEGADMAAGDNANVDNQASRAEGGRAGLQRIIDDLAAPNGLAFSPDERVLYVVESRAEPWRKLWAYDVDLRAAGPAALRNKRLFAEADDGGAYDGIAVDVDGNVWCGYGSNGRAGVPSTGLDGVRVLDPQGRAIGHVHLPERCANLCFGGAKNNRLFMAASHSLYALYVNVRGAV